MKSLIDLIPCLSVYRQGPAGQEIVTVEGPVKLADWRGFALDLGIGGQDEDAPDNQSDGSMRLSIGGDHLPDEPIITQAQVNSYRYLLSHGQRVRESLLMGLLHAYPCMQARYSYPPEDAAIFMPSVNDIHGFRSLIIPRQIHLLYVEKEDHAYMGFEFEARWDNEHGLGILMHKDSVVETGAADTAFLSWIAEQDAAKDNGEPKKPWWKLW